jgi:hypothetical protein
LKTRDGRKRLVQTLRSYSENLEATLGFYLQGLGILREAARLVFFNLTDALRMSLPWVLGGLALAAPLVYQITQLPLDPSKELSPRQQGQIAIEVLAIVCFCFIAGSSIAVNWHRLILLNERPGGRLLLRLDRAVWRYLGNSLFLLIFIGTVTALPLSQLSALSGTSIEGTFAVLTYEPESNGAPVESPGFVTYVVTVLADALVGSLFFCLALKLPAVAIGRYDFRFGDSWNQSGRYILLNAFIAATVSFITLVANRAMQVAVSPFEQAGASGIILVSLLWGVEVLALGFFSLSILTIMYQRRAAPVAISVDQDSSAGRE